MPTAPIQLQFPKEALGLLEVKSWSVAVAALDAAQKAGNVSLIQAELNDFYGVVMKLSGSVADMHAAIDAGRRMIETMHVDYAAHVIDHPTPVAAAGILAPPEYNVLIEQDVVHMPVDQTTGHKERFVPQPAPFAIGLIETQGFTAVIEAIDTAAKAANVEVIGKEKLGGGYVTIVIKGDVAAVQAAIDAGRDKVDGLGKLIAAHVIPRPSQAILGLLPQ